MMLTHYWEIYLFMSITVILAVYLAIYLTLLWLDDRRQWRRFVRKETR